MYRTTCRYTKTPLVQHILEDKATTAEVLARTPMRRVAEPEEVSGKAHAHPLYSLNFRTAHHHDLLLLHGQQKSCDLLHQELVCMWCADRLQIWLGHLLKA